MPLMSFKLATLPNTYMEDLQQNPLMSSKLATQTHRSLGYDNINEKHRYSGFSNWKLPHLKIPVVRYRGFAIGFRRLQFI